MLILFPFIHSRRRESNLITNVDTLLIFSYRLWPAVKRSSLLLKSPHLARNQNARIHQKTSAVYLPASLQAIFCIQPKPLQADMEALRAHPAVINAIFTNDGRYRPSVPARAPRFQHPSASGSYPISRKKYRQNESPQKSAHRCLHHFFS